MEKIKLIHPLPSETESYKITIGWFITSFLTVIINQILEWVGSDTSNLSGAHADYQGPIAYVVLIYHSAPAASQYSIKLLLSSCEG